jgi:hypothetical protein
VEEVENVESEVAIVGLVVQEVENEAASDHQEALPDRKPNDLPMQVLLPPTTEEPVASEEFPSDNSYLAPQEHDSHVYPDMEPPDPKAVDIPQLAHPETSHSSY